MTVFGNAGHKLRIFRSALITVCDPEAVEKCPISPGVVKRLHWGFKDPSSFQGTDEEKLEFTQNIRDQIKKQSYGIY